MKNEKIVWIDIETSGLDPEQDKILEIAAIITDMKGNKTSDSFSSLVHVDNFSQVINQSSDFAKKAHEKSGLWAELWNNKTPSISEVEEKIIEWLTKNTQDDTVLYFGGNSIFLDRAFTKNYMPKFYRKITHRSIDVTSISLTVRSNRTNTPWFPKNQNHRALQDINDSINEYKYYLKILDLTGENNQ